MRHRIEYAERVYRERVACEGCSGRGSIRPVHHGEREAPDGREAEPCEECDGAGYTVLELHGAEAEEARAVRELGASRAEAVAWVLAMGAA